MPKYTPEIAEAKAKKLIKSYVRNGLNQSAVAREEGVTSEAINQRFKHNPAVKVTLSEYLQRHFKKGYIKKKFQEGLEANKIVGYLNNKVDGTQKVSDEFVDVPDLHCRHKYLVTLLECQGLLKHNGNGNGASVINVIYAYRKPQEELCQPH